jgi:hypothetical protein
MPDPAHELNRAIAAELQRYPRGPNGSSQNRFRGLYQMRRSATFHQPDYDSSDCECDVVAQIRETDPLFVLRKAADLGRVSTDTGAILVVDPAYLMTEDDHAAGRTPASLASGYDAVYIKTGRDGSFPVLVEYDEDGTPTTISIDLRV